MILTRLLYSRQKQNAEGEATKKEQKKKKKKRKNSLFSPLESRVEGEESGKVWQCVPHKMTK
jgi:hypothetical protein